MNTEYEIEIHQRPSGAIRDEIVSIAQELTSGWFTPNVPSDTYYDLGFQDVMILKEAGRIVSFIMFTCLDGTIQLSLMGTRLESRTKGYGSILINRFCEHIKSIGFNKIMVYTVPPDTKPAYSATLAFYQKHGFRITRRFDELWESGAIQLVKDLSSLPARTILP
ncbi:MAG: GNAT family N-acetyltransferase [Bacteroidota bacterium]